MNRFENAKHRRDWSLDQAQRLIEVAISATPSSDVRNQLTDINILLLDVIDKLKEPTQ